MTPDREFIASRLDPISAWTDWEGLEGRAAAAVLAPLIDRPSGWHVILTLRPTRLRVLKPVNRWVVINVLAQLTYDGALVYFFGWKALAYIFISLLFSVGLHPLGARWIQEHYIVFPGQETVDYYGPGNRVALNIGYHNEHHDFPSIPWNRCPNNNVRAMVPITPPRFRPAYSLAHHQL